MLISLHYNFIFIANTKSASTSLEHELQRYCEISLRRQKEGKHWGIEKTFSVFSPLLNALGRPPESFLKFGVIRDPVSWMVSWYNYRSRNALPENAPASTKNIGFDEFVRSVTHRGKRPNYANLNPQSGKFVGANGQVLVDRLIPYDEIRTRLPRLMQAQGVPNFQGLGGSLRNVSPERLSASEVTPDLTKLINEYFCRDRQLYDEAKGRYQC